MDVIVVGGGWAGCAAALSAAQKGADVTLLEKTDLLLGTGLVGGIMRNNGRYTAAQELLSMGGGTLISLCDRLARHKNISFPGHEHASLYDVSKIEKAVASCLSDAGVRVVKEERIFAVKTENGRIVSVSAKKTYPGGVFIDATGSAGPMANCKKYGNGCAMCVLRCPAFGGRVSLAPLCGTETLPSIGAMSGSCKLLKDSLAPEIVLKLEETGKYLALLPERLRMHNLDKKACQQYALEAFDENIILLDTGHAKLMKPMMPLARLREIPGFENARYADPYAGGQGNSMRFFEITPCEKTMLASGFLNLFCAGERAGGFVGHTEAIVTGTLAGNNAVRLLSKQTLLALPETTACGHFIAYGCNLTAKRDAVKKITFSGAGYFEEMKLAGLYETDDLKIAERVRTANVENIFM